MPPRQPHTRLQVARRGQGQHPTGSERADPTLTNLIFPGDAGLEAWVNPSHPCWESRGEPRRSPRCRLRALSVSLPPASPLH